MPDRQDGHRAGDSGAIAVIGLAGRFPGAASIDTFWDNLVAGRETITSFSHRELKRAGEHPALLRDPAYVRAKGVVEDIDSFDAAFFGYTPREAEKMDPQLRLLHECCWEALENAGYTPAAEKGRIGLYVGANENQEWLRRVRLRENDTSDEWDGFLYSYRDYVSTRISWALDLKGPAFTMLSACSTSLVSIHLACQALRGGECGLALAGGVSLSLPQMRGYLYQDGLMVSRSGHCRTFDERADGTVFGEGVGIVVLKPLERAKADRDCIRAVIRGSAVTNDGSSKEGFVAPGIEGQVASIRSALERAGIEADDIGYVEAHGTAAPLGDAVEMQALARAFADRRNGRCRVGSVKTNIGHVNVAAGVAAFIKTVLTLENRLIPPNLHYRRPNPDMIATNGRFEIPTEAVAWNSNGSPRRAGVSAFGFGGTNAHMILEEAPRRRRAPKTRTHQLLVLSARSTPAVQEAATRLAAHLEAHPDTPLADAAWTLSAGRRAFAFRRTVVADDHTGAIAALNEPGTVIEADEAQRAVAFLFPGQGAQYVGMGADLYRNEPTYRRHFDRCCEIVRDCSGRDLRPVLFPEPGEQEAPAARLAQTDLAQPAIFAVSWALAKLWAEWGVQPTALIGHSIGELTAATLAGVFTLTDALTIVARRGELMGRLPPGAMLAVPLSEAEVQPLLDGPIALAAVNGPALCVLSGPVHALEETRRQLRERGVASRFLETSHAFHSPMMDPILEDFTALIASVRRRAPRLPVRSTVTGRWARPDELTDPAYWAQNLRSTVRFADALTGLMRESDAALLEIGPGRTLTNLAKMQPDTGPGRPALASLPGACENRDDTAFILATLGQLWQAGAGIDFTGFYRGQRRSRVPLPAYPFERRRFWLGAEKPRENALRRLGTLPKIPEMADWFSVPTWVRTPALPAPASTGTGTWLLLADSTGVADRLATTLRTGRRSVVLVEAGSGFERIDERHFIIAPGNREDYARLFDELAASNRLPRRILHLWSLEGEVPSPTDPPVTSVGRTDDSKADDERVDAGLARGFLSLLFLAQMIERGNIADEVNLLLVTDGLHEVTGTEVLKPVTATALGLVKVIPQEYPNIHCRNLDLAPELVSRGGDDLTGLLLAESLGAVVDRVTAQRGEHRWVQSYEALPLDRSWQKRTFLRSEGTYLITGGLGGIGLVLAESLARAARARLVLTTRSAFPPKNRWAEWLDTHAEDNPVSRRIAALESIEEKGGEVLIVRADVADAAAMRHAVARAEKRFGPITGVIHAAGIPGEGILQLKEAETALAVLRPKVHGTLVLAELFAGYELDFFVLCSSIAAVLGGIGLGDYASANNFLDTFAAARRHSPGLTVSVNWDMWGETGMGLTTEIPDELRDWFRTELTNGLTSREGVSALQRILTRGLNGNVVVATRDLQERLDIWIRRTFMEEKESLLTEQAEQVTYTRPNLSTSYDAPQTPIENSIATIWGQLFGIDRVGRHDNFYELGGHSLLATTMLNRLRQDFDVSISIRNVLDHPTVVELADLIAVDTDGGE